MKRLLLVGVLSAGAWTSAAQEVETVLLPIIANAAGAHGSQWTFDLFAHNDSDESVMVFGLRVADSPGIPPGRTLRLPVFPRQEAPPGQFLGVPKAAADKLRFQLHVRDVSGRTQSWGTQIPVVRERSFRHQITLPRIPLQEGFRHTLRIYTFGEPATVMVRLASVEGTPDDIASEEITVEGTGFTGLPGYVEVSGFDVRYPQVTTLDSVRITVESTQLIWAFASITNNKTQELTVFAPHD